MAQETVFFPTTIKPSFFIILIMLLTGIYLLLKVQELGLQEAYTSEDGVYRYIRKLSGPAVPAPP